MKYLLYTIITSLLVIFLGCNNPEPKKQESLEYDNILIYSDLSSRMNQFPNDSMIIEQLINFFVTECVKPGIKVNDRSSISFSRINYFNSKCPSAIIDINEIKSLEEKQKFVNDKSQGENLSKSIANLKDAIKCNYKEQDFGGLDILSLIFNEISSGNHIKKPSNLIGENDTTVINYHNHLFIFTDGYLEYSSEKDNNKYFFGQPQIEMVRQYCIKNNVSPDSAFKSNNNFKLQPLISENNKFVSLYILETDERGLNAHKGTLKYTGDLSDNNILKCVWRLWAFESGYKNFNWKSITKPSSLPKDYVKNLIVR